MKESVTQPEGPWHQLWIESLDEQKQAMHQLPYKHNLQRKSSNNKSKNELRLKCIRNKLGKKHVKNFRHTMCGIWTRARLKSESWQHRHVCIF